MFTTQFDSFVCEGDMIQCEKSPLLVTARVVYDHDTTPMDYDGKGCCFDTDDPEHGDENKAIIQSWKDDEWFYCGIVISVEHIESGVMLDDHAASLWGIECNFPNGDNSYLADVANELLNEAIDSANETLNKLK